MNKIIITGRLSRDPELKTTNNGVEFCNFSVAVDRRHKDADGTRKADFFNVTAWRQAGVFVNQYFKKGDGINIEGRMESRKYVDKEGNNRTAWEVQVDNIEFSHGKSGGDRYERAASGSDTATFTAADDDDSALPF